MEQFKPDFDGLAAELVKHGFTIDRPDHPTIKLVATVGAKREDARFTITDAFITYERRRSSFKPDEYPWEPAKIHVGHLRYLDIIRRHIQAPKVTDGDMALTAWDARWETIAYSTAVAYRDDIETFALRLSDSDGNAMEIALTNAERVALAEQLLGSTDWIVSRPYKSWKDEIK